MMESILSRDDMEILNELDSNRVRLYDYKSTPKPNYDSFSKIQQIHSNTIDEEEEE